MRMQTVARIPRCRRRISLTEHQMGSSRIVPILVTIGEHKQETSTSHLLRTEVERADESWHENAGLANSLKQHRYLEGLKPIGRSLSLP
jgi:hypothetical protein